MLEAVKLALRIAGTDFNTEIQMYIDDCLAEMGALGITNMSEGTTYDPQIISAVIAYAKWKFGNNEEKEDWHRIYADKLEKLQVMSGHTDWGN